MAQKHVVVTMNRPPYGTIFYTEGLRAALGVTAGIDENSVDVVCLGEGVYYCLKGVDRTDSAKYLQTLSGQGVKIKAEKESISARGLKAADLAEDVEVIPRKKVLQLIQAADATIDF